MTTTRSDPKKPQDEYQKGKPALGAPFGNTKESIYLHALLRTTTQHAVRPCLSKNATIPRRTTRCYDIAIYA